MSEKVTPFGHASKGSTQNVTQRIQPNKFYKPYLDEGLEAAQFWYDQYGAGQQYDPATLDALDSAYSFARGATLPGSAQSHLAAEIGGAYLDPRTDPRFGRALDEAGNVVSSEFGRANRLGSGSYYQAMADAGAGVATGLYGQARERQFDAMSRAPGVEASRYGAADRLRQVGAAREQMAWGGPQRMALGQYASHVSESPYAGYTRNVTPYYQDAKQIQILQALTGAAGSAGSALEFLGPSGQPSGQPYGSPGFYGGTNRGGVTYGAGGPAASFGSTGNPYYAQPYNVNSPDGRTLSQQALGSASDIYRF